MIDRTTKRLLKRIRHIGPGVGGPGVGVCPRWTNMELIRYVRDARSRVRDEKWDADYTWTIYISHDPCHDGIETELGPAIVADRWTVVAFHRRNGTFVVLGRELDRKLALRIARGET